MSDNMVKAELSDEDQPIVPQERKEVDRAEERQEEPEPAEPFVFKDKKVTTKMKKQLRIEHTRLAVLDFIEKFKAIYEQDMILINQKKPGKLISP